MRRAFAPLAVVACLLVALPAHAQQIPQPQQTPQQEQKLVTAELVRPVAADVLSGVVVLKGRGSSPAGVKKVAISIDGKTVAVVEPEELQQKVMVTYEWDTYLIPGTSKIAPNGEHTITVEAVSTGDQTDQQSIQLVADNAPVVPSRVRAVVRGTTASLSWAPNPEPDLLGYIVERNSGKGFRESARTRRPKYSEELAPGRYSYRVFAVRGSTNSDGAVASAPSQLAGAVVTAPPLPSGGAAGKTGAAGGGAGRAAGVGSIGKFFGPSGNAPRAPGLPSAPRPKEPPKPPKPPKVADVPEDNRREEWGKYKRTLPYDLDEVDEQAEPSGVPASVTRVLDSIVPPDGARWVLLGGVLLVIAVVVAVMARRIKVPKPAERDQAAEASTA